MKVVPGMALNVAGNVQLGEGLYKRREDPGRVYVSRRGILERVEDRPRRGEQAEGDDRLQPVLLQVAPSTGGGAIPQVGQTIIGMVTRLTTRYIGVDILVGEPHNGGEATAATLSTLEGSTSSSATYYGEPFKGTLRSQDVWPADDREAPSQLYQACRPGDLIRARIIGVGDASAGFLLSTGLDVELGVIFARGAASGQPMVPVSWREMICPQTGIKEARKAAKPQAS